MCVSGLTSLLPSFPGLRTTTGIVSHTCRDNNKARQGSIHRTCTCIYIHVYVHALCTVYTMYMYVHVHIHVHVQCTCIHLHVYTV